MVLDTLLKGNVDILYVNNYWFQDDYSVKPRQKEKQGMLMFSSAWEFTRRINVMLTFISGLVVRSGVGLNCRDEMRASNLVQLSWVFPLLRDGACFAILEDWVVAAKGSNSGGYGLVDVFARNLQKISVTIFKDKPALVSAMQNGVIVNFFPGFILEFRKGSSQFTDKNMAVSLEDAFGENWRYYVFLAPLIWLPLPIAIYYSVFLKVLRRVFRSILV